MIYGPRVEGQTPETSWCLTPSCFSFYVSFRGGLIPLGSTKNLLSGSFKLIMYRKQWSFLKKKRNDANVK